MKHRTTRFPVAPRRARASSLSTAAVEIDGMDVIADERVTLFPVTLIEIPRRAEADAGAPPEGSRGAMA